MLAVMSCRGNEYRPRMGRNALQKGAEIFTADVAVEPKISGALADPLANTSLALGVIVVDGVVLVEVVLGLTGTQGITHTHHAGAPRALFAACGGSGTPGSRNERRMVPFEMALRDCDRGAIVAGHAQITMKRLE